MRLHRFTAAAILLAALLGLSPPVSAQTKITVGMVLGGTGLHIPTYVAMDKGFFKQEGLDASWVKLNGKALVTAGLAGECDFVPIPSGGALAALHGAQLSYVVGQSLGSQWVIVTSKDIQKPEDLKGKTLGYGRVGSADYDEGATVFERAFHMAAGKDYKVISFQAEPERVAALINGDIQGALMTVPAAVKAQKAGFKILFRTSDYIHRLGGPIWTLKSYAEKNPDTVKRFDAAIAKAIMYIRDNKDGTIPVLKAYLGVTDPQEASLLWDQLHDTYDATMPKDLFREIFDSRRTDLIAAGQWPKDKPLPDTESFIARNLLDAALKEVHYVPVTPKVTN
ncbi:MAG TPA: ABC transporter substrate-binding protein [Stellaceae bacterium]|nr:ABC transporter substrate-binding protein [Stellaceae bacterium]